MSNEMRLVMFCYSCFRRIGLLWPDDHSREAKYGEGISALRRDGFC